MNLTGPGFFRDLTKPFLFPYFSRQLAFIDSLSCRNAADIPPSERNHYKPRANPQFTKGRGGSAWWSVGLIGFWSIDLFQGNPKVMGSNPIPGTIFPIFVHFSNNSILRSVTGPCLSGPRKPLRGCGGSRRLRGRAEHRNRQVSRRDRWMFPKSRAFNEHSFIWVKYWISNWTVHEAHHIHR